MAIELTNITKRFNNVIALSEVTHKVPKNEVHVLLGPNGSGKTTLMKITCGIIKPDKGIVKVLGKNPFEDVDIKAKMGYSPQDALLYDDLTGYDNALIYAIINGADKRDAKKRIKELTDLLQVGKWFFKRKLKTYSGGMIKKTSIITALAHDPEVIILDEPTSGLDPNSRRELWDFIIKLKNRKKTLLIATHLFEDAEVLADKVVIMHKGKKIAEGSPEELKRNYPCKYAIDVEFIKKPPMNIINELKELSIEQKMLTYGLTYRLYVDDPVYLNKVFKILEKYNTRAIRCEVKNIGLDDVYFMLTGVILGGE